MANGGFIRTCFLLALLFLAAQQAWLAAPLRAEIVDRIVAVVDGRVITWSSALAEANYQAFRDGREPLRTLEGKNLEKVVSQMIDRELIEKEKEISLFTPPDNQAANRALEEIRKQFSNQEAYQKALGRYGLTEEELVQHLTQESSIMAFIDYRLHPQVRLSGDMVETYYRDTLLPQLREQGQSEVPSLAGVRGQIEQVLVQQEINRLLDAWVQDLRKRAEIRMLTKG